MNEKEFEGFRIGYEATIAAGSHSTVDDCRQAREAYLKAELARQLTRIADQVSGYLAATVTDSTPVTADEFIELPDNEGNVHHFHQHDLEGYRDGWFHYKPQGGIRTPLTAKEIEAIVESPTSPDDALVEACRSLIKSANNDESVEASPDASGWTKYVWVTRKDLTSIESLVTAHKQAGER